MTRSQAEWVATAEQVLLRNYRQPPFVLTHGRGARLWDTEGRSYLDLCAGIAVCSVGHAHPRLVEAVAEQAARLMHVSNLFYNDRAIELAEALVGRTRYDRVFFCNSGAEAVEALLKLARRWHFEHGHPERVEFVAARGSFHGRTYGALSVTGRPKYRVGLAPLLGPVHFVPYGDLEAAREAVGPRTAAVLVEPMQGEGGLVSPPDGYLAGLRALCDEAGCLLLFDEVQTGVGRLGRFLAQDRFGVWADACSLAKGLGGGFPVGAMLLRERLADGLPPGSHATTFGGNPLAAAAALAVLRILDEERLVERAETLGRWLGEQLEALAGDPRVAGAVEVRGEGLLRGLRLAEGVDPSATLAASRERGVLLSLAGGDVLRFSPPLVITQDELEEGLAAVRDVLRDPPRLGG